MRREAERLAREAADPERLRQEGRSTDPERVGRRHVADADSHCGAGCTRGDVMGE
jgi:hypothetical protein